MEIQGAKEDGNLTGLSYLNTSCGIGPIVDKLPFGLQKKWVSSGSSYKEENHGRFPPFEYFCNFVCYEAKKRNNPSFMYHSSTTAPIKPDKLIVRNFNTNKPISVYGSISLILSKDAGHSETNFWMTERPSSRKKVYVSNVALRSHI